MFCVLQKQVSNFDAEKQSERQQQHALHRKHQQQQQQQSFQRSPVPSPPLPGSPSFQGQQVQAAAAENLSNNLYQHLQRLHLQQAQTTTASPFARTSPPTLGPIIGQQPIETTPANYSHLLQNLTQGLTQNLPQGLTQGLSQGLNQGLSQGLNQGLSQGLNQGLSQGLTQGLSQGLNQGLAQGLSQGLAQGLSQNLTQGLTPTHQRSSPPPVFQNLHIIQEDTHVDLSCPEDEEMQDISKQMTGGQSESASVGRDVKHRQYVGTPQISITDTQGHVTAVSTADDDSAMDTKESTAAAISRLSSPPGVTVSVSAMTSVGSPPRTKSPVTNPCGVNVVGCETYPKSPVHTYPMHMFSSCINTNLSNIQPPVSALADFVQPTELTSLYTTQYGPGANRVQRACPSRFRRHHTMREATNTFFQQPGTPNYSFIDFSTVPVVEQTIGSSPFMDFHSVDPTPRHVQVTSCLSSDTVLDLSVTTDKPAPLSAPRTPGGIGCPSPVNGCIYSGVSSSPSPSSSSRLTDPSNVLIDINPDVHKSVQDVLLAIRRMLDTRRPDVEYYCSDTVVQLRDADLQMELEVCEGDMPRVQLRKLSGDNLLYTRLCNDLLACVNN